MTIDGRMFPATLHMLRYRGLVRRFVIPSRFVAIDRSVVKRFLSFKKHPNMYTIVERGTPNSTDYRIFYSE
jgi:hypothetical protein